MTRDEARKAAEVMMAYAEGKDIEYLSHKSNKWELVCRGDDKHSNLALDFHKYKYRIKKEPKYRPFKDKEECWAEMKKHQPFGWVKNMYGSYFFVYLVSINGYVIVNDSEKKFTDAFDRFTFVDGTPFGIKEE